jgi:hypothetical protein
MANKKHKKDPKSWKIKRRRKGDEHIVNCSSGYNNARSKYKQVHHIVCVSSVADGTIAEVLDDDDDKFQLVRNCLKITAWDINAGHNCVALPLKRAFVDKRAPKGWDGWPCHQFDHPPYTDRVSNRLNVNVWQECLSAAEQCELEPKSVLSELKAESDFWLGHLTSRGAGSAEAWRTRAANPGTWYVPFSMHPDEPEPRTAPPDWDRFSGPMKQYLKALFSAL